MISKLSVPQNQIDDLRLSRQKRLEELKEWAETIQLAPLPRGQSYKAIVVSVDASIIPVETDVVDAVVIRCADSDGVVYFQGLVTTDAPRAYIEAFMDELFSKVPALQALLNVMQAPSWRVLGDFDVSSGATDIDRFVMELLEWGALVNLAENSSRTILLKDGLLRGKVIKPRGGYLDNLRTYFEDNCLLRGNYIVGIAKESAVLEKHKTLLQFVKGFKDNRAFHLKIPLEMLKETYGWRFYAADVIWGDLYFIRTQAHSLGRVMTVEVPDFLEPRLNEVLRILADFDLRSLPDRFRGLPDPIARAHENTKLMINFGKSLQKEIMR